MNTGTMWRTVVGPEFPGHKGPIYADELKNMTVAERAKVFKVRMDGYFKQQVGMFAPPNPPANFPLVVMTCIGIETLGAYKYGDLGRQKRKPGQSKVVDRHFQRLVEDMDADLKENAKDPDGSDWPLSDFVYKGFRHSLVHGFYGKWVCITAENAEASSWFYDQREKSLLLNVYWFYSRFCEVYEDYFRALLRCSNPSEGPLRTFHKTFEKYFGRWV